MAYSYTSLILQRVAIPIILVLAALFRPVGISFVYLLMFFISPFIPVATQRNFKGPVTAFLVILIAQSTLLILCHIALQVTIISLKMDDVFGNCSFTEQLLRHVGFIDFRNLKPVAVIEWLIPEVAVFATALTVYLVTKRLVTRTASISEMENGEREREGGDTDNRIVSSENSAHRPKNNFLILTPNFDRVINAAPLFCMASLFFAACLRPSVPGGFYFLIFLLTGTYWATIKTLGRGFSYILRLVILVLVMHVLCVVAYQTPWMQHHLDKKNLIARLIGLEPLVQSSCDNNNDIRIIVFDTDNYKIDSYFNPLVLCISFFILSLTARNLSKGPTVAKTANMIGQQLENGSNKFVRQMSRINHTSRGSKKDSWTKTQRLNVSLRREREQRPMIIEPTETTPLVRNVRKSRTSVDAIEGNSAQQASTSNIRLDSLDNSNDPENESHSSIWDQISYGFVSVGGFIYQNSYIFTNILMMAWSIVYHSWLTFVLLLWANLLWMIPNQRKAMMRSSPFIVFYAELLLLAQYIYGMDLTNDELPSKVDITGINLSQIGLDRPQEHGLQPCIPLIVKTSFLLMFWVTLRQFLKEKKEKRRDSTIADIFAPLQLTASAAGAATQPDGKKTSKFLKKAGDIFKNLLVRLWIWLLVLVIFLCAITGKQMTGFRICYMALFLFFLLVFQSSSKAWVKIMYGFWLFLIFYVMSILILIYTYQFDKFDQYWNDYLNIPKSLQLDIGLERYQTKDLFLHLVSPTIIVILTVIQVHYFHKRFIEALQQKPATSAHSSKQSMPRQRSIESVYQTTGEPDVKKSFVDLFKNFLRKVKRRAHWIFRHFKDVYWRFLELHLIKLVYITGFACSVSEVCVLHIVFVALCILGVCSRAVVQTFISRIISLIVTIIVLTKMIYQVTYLDHSKFDSECRNTNETVNDAKWFGLTKALPENGGLMGLLRPYIIYMIMVTLHAVVTLRQFQMRTLTGTVNQQIPRVLFPKIKRSDAEKNLNKMVKYLFNYGFYKFGLEISLIWLVSTITYRQDIMAVLYVLWLIVLLLLKRRQIARIWIMFEWFLGIAVILQYVILVGLPPHLCLDYPWSNTQYSGSIQRWAMLPGDLHLNHVYKLIFDFVLLMFVNRQQRVFNIETHLNEEELGSYAGGSNASVVKDIAKLGQVPFENPTRDFLSHVRNYLDIFQNLVLSGFYWITLAVVFVGGTNIFDLLALGYLIGAFVFLWEGSDFYLRPINIILRRWKWLIAYNVTNIVIKTSLQIFGCLFMDDLRTHCCWLVHVLGISCAARPFSDITIVVPHNECPSTTNTVVLLWDAICFAFLILQLRIFKSHYFCHMIMDTRANNLLASRGAEIIEDLRQKQIEHRQDHEREVLLKIKRKMEKIRATQQKMLRPIDKPTHFDAESPPEAVKLAPLARHSSFSSCQGSGYHTPDEDDTASCTGSHSSSSSTDADNRDDEVQLLSDADEHIVQCPHEIRVEYADVASSDMQTDYGDVRSVSDAGADYALALQLGGAVHLEIPDGDGSTPGQQPLTPSSELLTLPFDGFLETNRLSMGSGPNSDVIIAPLQEDPETETESNEVFVPTTYDTLQPPLRHTLMPPGNGSALTTCSLNVNVSRGSSVISSNLTPAGAVRHRRQSSVNAVSWNETVSVQCAPNVESIGSGEVSDDVPVTMRQKSLHRRHLSVGNATYSFDDQKAIDERRRRSSNISWARAEALLRSAARPNSWGPVEQGDPVTASRPHKRKEPKLHPEAVRAGDYYMFDDMDDKFELDIIEDGKDFLDEQEQLTESEKKMTRRKTLFDVWKDIQGAQYRRQMYMRQRSYASAPGSQFGFDKIDDEDFVLDGDTTELWEGGGGAAGARTSTHSEPLVLFRRSKSEYFDPFKTDKKPKDSMSSSSKIRDEDEIDITSEAQKEKSEAEKLAEKAEDEELTANPIVRLLEGFFVSMTIRLNRFSRNYRYVNKILAEEKRALKESDTLKRIGRPGAASMFNVFKRNVESLNEDPAHPNAGTSQNDITQLTDITPTEPNISSQLQTPQDSVQQQQQVHADHDIIEMPLDTVDNGTEKESSTSLNKPRFYRVDIIPEIRIKAPSIERSQEGSGTLSKQWSYERVDSTGSYSFDDAEFAARDHNIFVEVLISLWYAILSNTDLICYIVIFINQVCNASIISLPLPIMVFLWGTLSLPRPTKTFWVTLIAYTQAIVLIKCIFQYKLIWANYINLPNQPLGWAKILGVEERENYANIDLLVLLVLFLHRFILKSQGLWKMKFSHSGEEIKPIEDFEKHIKIVLQSDEEIRPIEDVEKLEDSPKPDKPEAITSGDEDWKDALSNPELIREAKLQKEKQLVKRDDGTTDEERERGGKEKSIRESKINDVGDHLSLTSTEASDKYIAGLHKLKRAKYLSSLRKFFFDLVNKPRLPDDVYALMFLCDFINFFVLLFGFSAFSSRQSDSGDGGVQAYLAENKVPIPFLIMLLVQFILIVIDRALYLRKALIPKIVFHFFSVVGIHIWMFFVVPAVTERSFYKLAPPIIFYIFKCFYLLLSSYQIKCGYPRRILGNFLTKGFSVANMITFKVFMTMPFLYELRTILDWVCTDTTMTLFDWLKMEDIFSDIFFIRCSRQMEQDFPAIRAQKKALHSKLLLGGTIILAIVVGIWGPLCLFALGKTVGQSNVPYEVRLSIRIGPYDPIYETNNRESIFSFNEKMYDNMTNAYKTNREAVTFITGYDAGDIAAVKLAGNAPSLWKISPPDRERLLKDLRSGHTLTARFTYSFTRVTPAKGLSGTVSSEKTIDLNSTFPGRAAMINMLEGTSNGEIVVLPDLVPKFLKVLNSGEIFVVSTLMPSHDEQYRPLVVTVHNNEGSTDIWWEIRDYCDDFFHNETLSKLPMVDCDSGIVMYTFNDKKFPSTFSWLTAGGIFGLYTTFVLVASRFLKGFIGGQNRKILFEDLPYVDRVLQLCLDIYLVREALEFALEEDLFAKLIFLYRSPETLIKWTRPKEELNDDETDSESVPSRSSMRRLPERGAHEQQQPQ